MITVAIPTIPPRRLQLWRALESVDAQTMPAAAVVVAVDHWHDGAWTTRNRAARMSKTAWTAFLDDDDELLPHHLETLYRVAAEENADLVVPWFTVVGGTDPFPQDRGRQWDPQNPHVFPITYLVRTSLLHAAMDVCGGFLPDEDGSWYFQDGPLIETFVRLGGRVRCIPDITWKWHHWGANTSGLPGRW